MRKLVLTASLACTFGALDTSAADSAVDGPKLGYVNSAAGVRRVLGVPGASRLSAPVTGELEGALVLPGSDAAVVKNADGGLVRIDLRDGSVASLGVANVEEFAVSPSGSAIVARIKDKLHIISADGEGKGEYDAPANIVNLAVSDEGAIAASIGEEDGEALYLITAEASKRVQTTGALAGLAFRPGSLDLLFAERSGRVYLLKSDLQLTELATVKSVRAIAGTVDGLAIVVAGRTVISLRMDGSVAASVDCSFEAVAARPLGNSKFLLNTGDDGPLWLLDASDGGLRVAFVPEAVNE